MMESKMPYHCSATLEAKPRSLENIHLGLHDHPGHLDPTLMWNSAYAPHCVHHSHASPVQHLSRTPHDQKMWQLPAPAAIQATELDKRTLPCSPIHLPSQHEQIHQAEAKSKLSTTQQCASLANTHHEWIQRGQAQGLIHTTQQSPSISGSCATKFVPVPVAPWPLQKLQHPAADSRLSRKSLSDDSTFTHVATGEDDTKPKV